MGWLKKAGVTPWAKMNDAQRCIHLKGMIERLDSRLEIVEGILVEHGLAEELAMQLYGPADAKALMTKKL